jgi:hypothetical protein
MFIIGDRFIIAISDKNGRKISISTSVSIFVWRKQDRVRKIWVWKRNRDMRMHENKQIRMESRKIKLE